MKKAVILLSGGVDSAVTLAIADSRGFEPYALSFRYGQRHAVELAAASRVAQNVSVRQHLILDIDLGRIGGSALTADLDVPKNRDHKAISQVIPDTYVPARNTIFLSYGLAWAEVLGSADIFIGVNALDYSGYPDCRPEYVAAFERLANLATRACVEGRQKITIHAPLIDLKKSEIILKGIGLGVDFSLTHSCYDPAPDGSACGQCDSCVLRLMGFREAGVKDPVKYQDRE
jgi:7-cyano-7-deazaguanine synthase